MTGSANKPECDGRNECACGRARPTVYRSVSGNDADDDERFRLCGDSDVVFDSPFMNECGGELALVMSAHEVKIEDRLSKFVDYVEAVFPVCVKEN